VENLTLTGTGALNGTGNSLANRLTGNSGNNVLDGGSGADTLSGGDGDDSYVVDQAGDLVSEQPGAGSDQVKASITWTLAANVENLLLTGSANTNGTGNTGNNTLTGNTGNNELNGGSGSDTLAGGAGNDTYVVDETGDIVSELAVADIDTVQSAITYSLVDTDGVGVNGGNVENLVLTGSAGINGTGNALANSLTGNSGNNTLLGGFGNDVLNGGEGDDFLDGGSGTDRASYAGATAGVQVNLGIAGVQPTGMGDDTLVAIENVSGSSYDDTLIGDTRDNVLDGGSGLDMLIGGLGDDIYVVDSLGDVVVEETGRGNRPGAGHALVPLGRQPREPVPAWHRQLRRGWQQPRQCPDRQWWKKPPHRLRWQRHARWWCGRRHDERRRRCRLLPCRPCERPGQRKQRRPRQRRQRHRL
jgi:Ca2+-binding RTX toxin-like protein